MSRTEKQVLEELSDERGGLLQNRPFDKGGGRVVVTHGWEGNGSRCVSDSWSRGTDHAIEAR